MARMARPRGITTNAGPGRTTIATPASRTSPPTMPMRIFRAVGDSSSNRNACCTFEKVFLAEAEFITSNLASPVAFSYWGKLLCENSINGTCMREIAADVQEIHMSNRAIAANTPAITACNAEIDTDISEITAHNGEIGPGS